MSNILFHKDKPIIGIDISHTGIKVMFADPKKLTVHGYGSIEIDPKELQNCLQKNDTYLEDKIKELFKNNIIGKVPLTDAVVGIPTSRTFSRTFSIPLKNESDIENAVELEADQYIPVPTSSLYLDYEVIKKTDKSAVVLMSAVQKNIVDNVVQSLKNSDINPIAIIPSINAVAKILKQTEEGHLPTVIVDISQTSTDIAILDGSIRVTGSVGIGGNNFTVDIAKKLDTSLENAHQLKVSQGLSAGPRQQKIMRALNPSLSRITDETKKVMRYYSERLNGEQKLEQIIIVGGGSNIPGIGEFFTNDIIMPARVASPWAELDFGKLKAPEKQFRARYIAATGLALTTSEEIWK